MGISSFDEARFCGLRKTEVHQSSLRSTTAETVSERRDIGGVSWTASDLRADASWVRHFKQTELREIQEATSLIISTDQQRDGKRKPHSFPLPSLDSTLSLIRQELISGRGVALLRGLNVDDYEADSLRILYLGLGSHVGTVVPQNSEADVITDVTSSLDANSEYQDDARSRGHRGRASMLPHSDSADIVGLFCVRAAKRGGCTHICSSLAIHDELFREHGEYLPTLYEGFYFDMTGKSKNSNVSASRIPVFQKARHGLSCHFNQRRIEVGMKTANVPLRRLQKAALDEILRLAASKSFSLDINLVPGDILFLNNHITLHGRDEYEDGKGHKETRLLLRIWLGFAMDSRLRK